VCAAIIAKIGDSEIVDATSGDDAGYKNNKDGGRCQTPA
jgi:hypothetical protein